MFSFSWSNDGVDLIGHKLKLVSHNDGKFNVESGNLANIKLSYTKDASKSDDEDDNFVVSFFLKTMFSFK